MLRQLQVNGSTGLISIVGANTALSLAPLDGQPAIDYRGTGGLDINTSIALGRPFAIVRAVSAVSTITFQQPITETETPRGIRKQGLGVVRFNLAPELISRPVVQGIKHGRYTRSARAARGCPAAA